MFLLFVCLVGFIVVVVLFLFLFLFCLFVFFFLFLFLVRLVMDSIIGVFFSRISLNAK